MKTKNLLKNNAPSFVSALLAGAFFLFACYYFKAFPFDSNYCLLNSDLAHQYYPMLTHLYDIVKSGKDILYSWSSGFGYPFIGNFGVVASPFNLIIFLFKRENIPLAITIIILAKLMVIAYCFSYYMRKVCNHRGVFNIIPSLLYALSGFFAAYHIHIMWLDSLYCLPILIVGFYKLIDEKKPWLYICTLTFMMITGVYTAYMMCIFLCAYFVYSYILKNNIKQDFANGFFASKLFKSGLFFAGASVLSALLAAFMLIPIGLLFKTASESGESAGNILAVYFNPFRFLAQQFSGSTVVFQNEGEPQVPNCWAGMLTVILIPAYLFSKAFSKKEKIADISLLAFMYLSLSFSLLSYIWCGFHFANGFADRFAYFYIFVAVTIMSKALNNIDTIRKAVIPICAVSAAAFIVLMRLFDSEEVEKYTVIISLSFIAIWLAVYFISWIKKTDKALLKLVALFAVCMELVFAQLDNININSDKRDFERNSDSFSSICSLTKENDGGLFCRMEACIPQNYMYPYLMNYSGITGFSSMIPKSVLKNQNALGAYANTYNRVVYFPQTPVYNSVFAVKYLIGETASFTDGAYFEKSVDNGFFASFKNKYYLPLGYCVNVSASDFNSEPDSNPFYMQNELFSSFCGVNDVFGLCKYDSLTAENASCVADKTDSKTGTEIFTVKSDDSENGKITFTYTLPDDGDYYIYISHGTNQQKTEITFCGNEIKYAKFISDFSFEPNCIIPLGEGSKDGTLSVVFDVNKATESKPLAVYVASFDREAFVRGYNILKANTLNLIEFENLYFNGTVNADRECLLFTSVPYDKGWKIKLDGKSVDADGIVKVDGAFISVPLNQGEHTVEFRYFPAGMKTGAVISLCAVAGIAVYLILRKKNNK